MENESLPQSRIGSVLNRRSSITFEKHSQRSMLPLRTKQANNGQNEYRSSPNRLSGTSIVSFGSSGKSDDHTLLMDSDQTGLMDVLIQLESEQREMAFELREINSEARSLVSDNIANLHAFQSAASRVSWNDSMTCGSGNASSGWTRTRSISAAKGDS